MKPGTQKAAKADDGHRASEGQAGDNKNEGKAEHNAPRLVDLPTLDLIRRGRKGMEGFGEHRPRTRVRPDQTIIFCARWKGHPRRVTGLGGISFKAKDPKAPYEWYRLHLGIESNPNGSGANWRDADHPEIPGCCVWGIFPQDTTYFGSGPVEFHGQLSGRKS